MEDIALIAMEPRMRPQPFCYVPPTIAIIMLTSHPLLHVYRASVSLCFSSEFRVYDPCLAPRVGPFLHGVKGSLIACVGQMAEF